MRNFLALSLGLLACTPAFAAKSHHRRPVAVQPANNAVTPGGIAQAPAPAAGDAAKPAETAKGKGHKKHAKGKGAEAPKAPEAAPAK